MKNLKKWAGFGDLSLIAITGLVLSSCNDRSAYSKEIADLNDQVQHYRDSMDYYLSYKWTDLDNSFAAKKASVARDTISMSQSQKDSFYSAVNSWTDYGQEYTAAATSKANVAAMDDIRNSLHIDGVRIDYADLGADNIVEQYQHFVDVVKANKDNYSKEQWVVVNTSWKELNGRRKEIKSEITAKDENKILKLKMEYTGIKVINRPSILNEED